MRSGFFSRIGACFLLLAALVLMPTEAQAAEDPSPSVAAATSNTVLSQTITIGNRPLWKKIVRGTARAVTLGTVQAAVTLKQNEPFSLAFDHDGLDTDYYNVYVNTALRETMNTSRLVNGTASSAFPQGLPKGTYNFQVKAFGPGGEGASEVLTQGVTAGNPSNPGKPRIVK